MDRTRLDAIRARCEAATPGEWTAVWRGNTVKSHAVITKIFGQSITGGISPRTGNAEFIAHARTDVPDLLAEIERLTAELAATESDRDVLREEIQRWRDGSIIVKLADTEADRDAWRIRSEAAEADLNHIAQEMFSDNSEDLRGEWYPCEVCRKYDGGKDCFDCLAASYDESKPGTAFEWRGPAEDKHGTA